MRRHRRAKIVATLGPASESAEMIHALFDAGADVFRLNFSHGAHAEHAQRVRTIRSLERQTGRPVGILMDLQGPKLRVGLIAGGAVELAPGAPFRLDLADAPGDSTRAPMPHPEIFQALSPGTDVLLDDGKIRLRVTSCGADFAETEVITDGKLSDRKGVNVPQAMLGLSALTDKDREDLRFGLVTKFHGKDNPHAKPHAPGTRATGKGRQVPARRDRRQHQLPRRTAIPGPGGPGWQDLGRQRQ